MAVRRSTARAARRRRAASAPQSCLLALEPLGSMLATAQLGITVCSVVLGAVAEAALHHLLEPVFHGSALSDAWPSGVALALALLDRVYLHVVVGEMIPKNLAIAGPDRAALVLVPAALRHRERAAPDHPRDGGGREGPACGSSGSSPRTRSPRRSPSRRWRTSSASRAARGSSRRSATACVAKTLEFSDKRAREVAVDVRSLTTVELGRDARRHRAARRQAGLLALPGPRRRGRDRRLPPPQGHPLRRRRAARAADPAQAGPPARHRARGRRRRGRARARCS